MRRELLVAELVFVGLLGGGCAVVTALYTGHEFVFTLDLTHGQTLETVIGLVAVDVAEVDLGLDCGGRHSARLGGPTRLLALAGEHLRVGGSLLLASLRVALLQTPLLAEFTTVFPESAVERVHRVVKALLLLDVLEFGCVGLLLAQFASSGGLLLLLFVRVGLQEGHVVALVEVVLDAEDVGLLFGLLLSLLDFQPDIQVSCHLLLVAHFFLKVSHVLAQLLQLQHVVVVGVEGGVEVDQLEVVQE